MNTLTVPSPNGASLITWFILMLYGVVVDSPACCWLIALTASSHSSDRNGCVTAWDSSPSVTHANGSDLRLSYRLDGVTDDLDFPSTGCVEVASDRDH